MINGFPTHCQGHGEPCPGEYCEADHGVVSYCDGTCTEARLLLRRDIMERREPHPPGSTDHITLEFGACDGSSAWLATFEGPDAEDRALTYMTARRSTHVVYELPEQPFDYATFPALAAKLYPECEHGLSLNLCYGPDHYPSREQEIAYGW